MGPIKHAHLLALCIQLISDRSMPHIHIPSFVLDRERTIGVTWDLQFAAWVSVASSDASSLLLDHGGHPLQHTAGCVHVTHVFLTFYSALVPFLTRCGMFGTLLSNIWFENLTLVAATCWNMMPTQSSKSLEFSLFCFVFLCVVLCLLQDTCNFTCITKTYASESWLNISTCIGIGSWKWKTVYWYVSACNYCQDRNLSAKKLYLIGQLVMTRSVSLQRRP